MKVSIVDLRYKMNNVLKALAPNEEVKILYRGKPKGGDFVFGKKATKLKVKDHPSLVFDVVMINLLKE